MLIIGVDQAIGEDKSGYVVVKRKRNGVLKVLAWGTGYPPIKWLRRKHVVVK